MRKMTEFMAICAGLTIGLVIVALLAGCCNQRQVGLLQLATGRIVSIFLALAIAMIAVLMIRLDQNLEVAE